jgi:protein-S-isoprenylcysteine O-methyltransferase Ste14
MASGWSRIARRIRVPLGFVFAAVFLWAARPSALSMLLSLMLVVPGLWLRAYAAGYVKKNAELTMTGPYGYTRNPLYLGSMLIAFGFAAASQNVWVALTLAALFIVIYVPVIRSEEEFLRATFRDFDDYARRVPRLLPRLRSPSAHHPDSGSFSAALWKKHREYNALMGAAAIYAALIVRMILHARGLGILR